MPLGKNGDGYQADNLGKPFDGLADLILDENGDTAVRQSPLHDEDLSRIPCLTGGESCNEWKRRFTVKNACRRK